MPSLRYWVHLVAPGWNVIGGGEPSIPGVSVGHNEHGAWGLTVFATDGEDLYVYETNPANPRQYRYDGQWRDLRVRKTKIGVKNGDEVAWKETEIEYSHHGPIVSHKNGKGYAMAIPYFEEVGLTDQTYATMTARNLAEMEVLSWESSIDARVDWLLAYASVEIQRSVRNLGEDGYLPRLVDQGWRPGLTLTPAGGSGSRPAPGPYRRPGGALRNPLLCHHDG